MTVVSTKEFNTNQAKYFDMAVSGDVCIKNDKYYVSSYLQTCSYD